MHGRRTANWKNAVARITPPVPLRARLASDEYTRNLVDAVRHLVVTRRCGQEREPQARAMPNIVLEQVAIDAVEQP